MTTRWVIRKRPSFKCSRLDNVESGGYGMHCLALLIDGNLP